MRETIYNTLNDTTLQVEREFDGPVDLVWKAWTDADILAEWWAPEPFKAVTKSMDFRNGGKWHYYMLGPDGSKFWCMVTYSNIEPLKQYNCGDYFCDEEGNVNNELPGSDWENVFTDTGSSTKVIITVTYQTKEDMEKTMSMGFKEGFRMGHENLDKWLAAKK